ncbi:MULTISPECIES: hypothetical protein [Frankia]|uniref:Uncharacterized protein n=1 Tax=Frankia alni (strain DSM 45986 / CECT 9034 / ACN14a) TaxID=326424 RepID=Q0RU20_FRAAA|nr:MULTISPECIES: hypothetical protein [Frankia]CAJ58924.1 hypothetical protein FRAAL0247 [Frankia alni ACN14a]
MSRPPAGAAPAGSAAPAGGAGDWLLFPAFRALELTMAMPEIRPLRIFSVRWPLWQVEVQATFEDSQPFDVVDHYLLRGVVEGRLQTQDELARFFGLSGSLVARGIEHLLHIGHLQRDGRDAGVLWPTELGGASVRDGVRYVLKESRQLLLFDAFTHRPFPRAYYDGSVRIVPDGEGNPGDRRDRFRPLTSPRPFEFDDAVRAVGSRPDRDRFNVPRRLRNLHPVSNAPAWLPAHLVLADGATVLAFTQAAQDRDRFLEELCRHAPQVVHTLVGERGAEPRQIWVEWLRAQGLGQAVLTNLPNGVWRATLPSQTFGPAARQPYYRLGSFQVKDTYFLQLWCDDEQTRATAVRSRALAISRRYGLGRAEFEDSVATVANLLEVLVPTFDELLEYAAESGTPAQLRALEALR